MIHYMLTCEAEHGFEGWFRSSADFEEQAASGRIACPVCESRAVSRGLMAPAVRSARSDVARPEPRPMPEEKPAAPADAVPMVLAEPAQRTMLQALRELREAVVKNADYVGDRFAEEARKIHYGETDHRGIYGEATLEDAQALAEEGIEIQPLPVLPDDRN